MDLQCALPALKDGFELVRTAIGAVKDAKDLLPAGDKKVTLEKSIGDAERTMKIAEAQIAKALGYHLCQCCFPPQIMTSKGYHPKRGTEVFECATCQKQHPSPHYFAELDRTDAAIAASYQRRSGSWMV
jgi:hypothetical protein